MTGSGIKTPKDGAVTVLAVLGSYFLVGHATSLIGDSVWSGWGSAAAFTLLAILYASLASHGRRSGPTPFLLGAALVFPLMFVWLIVGLSFEGPFADRLFDDFQVGFSGRGCGHAGPFCWMRDTVLAVALTGLALLVRGLLRRGR